MSDGVDHFVDSDLLKGYIFAPKSKAYCHLKKHKIAMDLYIRLI
jgi:hypothetical protein